MTKNGGNMADSGAVSYMFSRKGVNTVKKGELTEDDVLLAVLDAGAEQVNDLGDMFEVVSDASDSTAVKEALQAADIEVEDTDSEFRASVENAADLATAKKILKLIDILEESDDVQNVYTNMDIPEDVAAQLEDED